MLAALSVTAGVQSVSPPEWNPAGDTAVITIVPTTGPGSEETDELVDTIRADLPAAADQGGASAFVTGTTAVLIDFSETVGDAMLPYLALVAGLSLVLLTLIFRSVVVPVKTALGFLLTMAATFGVLVAVFQWGWLDDLGIEGTGMVISLLPIFIIGVVFGLAMDYEVFLVTRMREEYAHGATALEATRVGFLHGSRVVAAAAVIMISVFGGFVLNEAVDVIQIGLALAAAIAVDAFVVRMTIVPAVMAVVGSRVWWLPRWLDRLLPDVHVEGARAVGDVGQGDRERGRPVRKMSSGGSQPVPRMALVDMMRRP